MLIYFFMVFFLITSSWFVNHIKCDEKKRKIVEIILLMGVIALIIMLRHPSMGRDLQYRQPYGYLWSFEKISSYSFSEIIKFNGWMNYEWGYILFNKAISFISGDIQCLLICCAMVSIIPAAYIIYKYSEDYFFSICVYLGLPSFLILYSGLRQGIGIAICFFSFKFIIEKKPVFFILTVLFASLFHYTAIVFLIAYPMFYLKLSKQLRLALLLLVPIVFLLRVPIFGVLSKLLKDNAKMDFNGAVTLLIVFFFVYIYCVIFLTDDEISSGLVNCFYIAVLCMCFGNIYLLAMRVAYYFMIPLVIALPNIVKKIDNANSYIISKYGIEIVFILYALYGIYTSGRSWPLAYPYHFFWEFV